MKLHAALLLVAVLVAYVSAKSVRPQNKALFKKLLQNRIASASEKTEEDAGKLAQAEKLEKSWGYTGYGASYDWLCAWYPGDCELGCCRKSESESEAKESLNTKFGNSDTAYNSNTGGQGGGHYWHGYGANPHHWACAWFPYDCEKCPTGPTCGGSGSESGSEASGSGSGSEASGSGVKEALSTKFGMGGEDNNGAESYYQHWECAWYPNDCEKCPSACAGSGSGSGSSSGSGSGAKEALSTKFGMVGEENTGGEAWAQDWACAWYPNDCAKCPSACASSGSGSGSGSGAKEALSTKYGMVGEESSGAESWYQEEECAWYPNDCTKCPSGPKCTKNAYDVVKGLSDKRLAALEKLAERLLQLEEE